MCKFCKLLCRLIPWRSFQAFLIKKHVSGCHQCQRDIEEAKSLIEEMWIAPVWVEEEENLWPQIKHKFSPQEEKTLKTKRKYGFFLLKRWQWALACLLLVVAIGLSVLVPLNFLRRTSVEEASSFKDNPRVKIKYAEIYGKKAMPYIYQTPTISFIWFAETNK